MAASYGFDISRPAVMPRKPFSGSTSPTSPASRNRTARRCRSGRRRRFSTSTSSGICRRRTHRAAGPGDRRRLRHQTAHRPLSENPRIRRALRRRSDLGHGIHRRHGRRRPVAGDQDQFPFSPHALQPWPGPEPNLTIWYSPRLPDGFRSFAAKVAIDTSSLQFESDEIMRRAWGDDGAIACCVSPMLLGKQMQFFGARANLAKCLLYAINGGRDEINGEQVGPRSNRWQVNGSISWM